MSSPVAEVLGSLSRAFANLQLRWFLFGAQAAIVHGSRRFSADVDVTVDAASRTVGQILESLRAEGFTPRTAAVRDFVERTRVLPLVHDLTTVPVDVVFAGPGIEDLFFENLVHTSVPGMPIPVISAEDLIAAKIFSGRTKDLEDAEAVLAAQRDALDLARIRYVLEILESALDRSDLRPELDRMVGRIDRGGPPERGAAGA